MKKKTLILYDLKDKPQKEKVAVIRKLYGYRDKSNYDYTYDRIGALEKISYTKKKMTVLELKDANDLPKVIELLNKLNIRTEVVRTA